MHEKSCNAKVVAINLFCVMLFFFGGSELCSVSGYEKLISISWEPRQAFFCAKPFVPPIHHSFH